jgi:hypothetical protein
MSMTAGEYVSVSSQSDTERAEIATQPEFEREKLARIYMSRGLTPELARQVAEQLMSRDALGAHARDELGISEATTARPIQAAPTSAATFAVGAAMPLVMVLVLPAPSLVLGVSITSLLFLALLGALGARAGGPESSPPRLPSRSLRIASFSAPRYAAGRPRCSSSGRAAERNSAPSRNGFARARKRPTSREGQAQATESRCERSYWHGQLSVVPQ